MQCRFRNQMCKLNITHALSFLKSNAIRNLFRPQPKPKHKPNQSTGTNQNNEGQKAHLIRSQLHHNREGCEFARPWPLGCRVLQRHLHAELLHRPAFGGPHRGGLHAHTEGQAPLTSLGGLAGTPSQRERSVSGLETEKLSHRWEITELGRRKLWAVQNPNPRQAGPRFLPRTS